MGSLYVTMKSSYALATIADSLRRSDSQHARVWWVKLFLQASVVAETVVGKAQISFP